MFPQNQVLGDGEISDHPVPVSFLRYVGQSALHGSIRGCAGEIFSAEQNLAGRGGPQAGDHLGQLPLAVARHSGQAQDLASPDLQVYLSQSLRPPVAQRGDSPQLEPHGSGRPFDPLPSDRQLAPHHHAGQLGLAGAGRRFRADHPAVPQHGNPIADVKDLVQFVRDEDQGMALAGHLAQSEEELVDLLGCEHGGRLVQDQQGRAAVEGLHDFDPLLFADRQLPDGHFRIDLQAVDFRQLQDAA